MTEKVAVLDFGSQYSQLIARRVRELGVFSEIVSHDTSAESLREMGPKALILSGGPASVLTEGSPRSDPRTTELGIPMLGICYGMQLLAQDLGGRVRGGVNGEYGPANLKVDRDADLFAGLGSDLDVWMSHGDRVEEAPDGFVSLAHTTDCRFAAMGNPQRKVFGVQFHPEVVHTPRGKEILKNFLFGIAGCRGDWTMAGFIEEEVERIRSEVGSARVVCGLSGGVDSTVAAALLERAIGDQMTSVFVDNGVLRAGEAEEIRETFSKVYPLNLCFVDARQRFLDVLRGVTDPEVKRKAIGKTFIDVFEDEAGRIGGVEFLAQGTLYPDVIESRSPRGGPSATIKSHHNVGGLPEKLGFRLIEPLKDLFKDEVRLLGRELGLPESIINRQPFPGPGLAVRILGEVTEKRLAILREADRRVREEIDSYERVDTVWQWFAVLLPVKSVGVMGDERTYAYTVAVRAVSSLDGMTADWARLPHDLLARISSRIINEVKGVNRVVYDISSKPPSTIEWE